jgi:hypothetical protein
MRLSIVTIMKEETSKGKAVLRRAMNYLDVEHAVFHRDWDLNVRGAH